LFAHQDSPAVLLRTHLKICGMSQEEYLNWGRGEANYKKGDLDAGRKLLMFVMIELIKIF